MSVRVAIVAGAGGVLGHAATAALATGGLTVVAVDRKEEEMRDLPDGVHREVADPARCRS
jgi:NADP-dependent 3-hydroxy acid dehydrogenase YdfG